MERFDVLLFETMDDTIRQVLGESASELIYRLVESHVSLKREEIGEKIEAYYAYFAKLFGLEGVQIIQATSLKRLCLKLRREYEEVEGYFSFLDELYEIKFKLLVSSLEAEVPVSNRN